MPTNQQDDIDFCLREYPDRTRRIAQYGFLELESTWGDEATIINTARISTTDNRVEDSASLSDRDRTDVEADTFGGFIADRDGEGTDQSVKTNTVSDQSLGD